MKDESKEDRAGRRRFLKQTALGAATVAGIPGGGAAPAPDAGPPAAPLVDPGREYDGPPLFNESERLALHALADHVLPGAGGWGAPEYIERTLTMFDIEPPRLYAGTVGSTDEWLPFDRVRDHAWRLRILGSKAVHHPNDAVLGPVPGYRPTILEGAQLAAPLLAGGASPGAVWKQLSDDFRDNFTVLVLEGSLGDPVYGGNREGAAWREFHFEGSMLGYGTFLPRREGPGGEGATNPSPLGFFTRAALWVMGFFSRRIA